MVTTAPSPNQHNMFHLNKNLKPTSCASTSLHVSSYEISWRIGWQPPYFSLVLSLPLRPATYILFFSAIRKFQWHWTPVGMRVLLLFPFLLDIHLVLHNVYCSMIRHSSPAAPDSVATACAGPWEHQILSHLPLTLHVGQRNSSRSGQMMLHLASM